MREPYAGLTIKEVAERRRVGLSNKFECTASKSVRDIIISNTFTYFNLVFLIISIVIILTGKFENLTFLPVIIANSLIGILQELRAKKVLDNLKVLNAPVARVVRDYKLTTIPVENLVLDDIIVLRAGDQIPADAVVLSGEVAVDEALLTGESDEVDKKADAELMSGSFVVYGECYARLTKVGESSYAAQLTLKAKAIKTEEQSEIIKSLNAFVKLAGVAIIPIAIIMFCQQFFFRSETATSSALAAIAVVIGMIPEGLFLLASVTLVLSAMRLARSSVMLHDMKSIETLARVDVLCVDKTGTITSNEMTVLDTVWLGRDDDKRAPLIRDMIAEVVAVESADSPTMAALKKEYKRASRRDFRLDDFANVVKVQGFSSKYKYSGVQFEKVAYVLGAPEFVLRDDFSAVSRQVEKWTRKGARVLVFGKYGGRLDRDDETEKPLTAKVEALALIVIENKVRETAAETFKYFADQGVEVKVISGDTPLTVAEVAKKAGILNANKYVDMSEIHSQRELEKVVKENTVFGRVTPTQKRKIVKVLQSAGHMVAMTGDGVNDVLALKDADCSVAMASGSQAAVQAAQVVLLESDFSKMPSVVREGRRVVNNLQRSGSLFIVKNIFSFSAALFVIIMGIKYPMLPTQVSLISMWAIGVPSFLLAQIPTEQLIRGDFMQNLLKKAVPVAIANVLLIMLTLALTRIIGVDYDKVGTLCTFVWGAVALTHLGRVCREADTKLSAVIWFLCLIGMIICFMLPLISVAISVNLNIYKIDLGQNLPSWIIVIAMSLLALPTILGVEKLILKFQNWGYPRYLKSAMHRSRRK